MMILAAVFLCIACSVFAREYHVSPKGNDGNSGIVSAPFRTIAKAASVAMPGDTITVHAGVYREWVAPPRGGSSDSRRIVYRAAPGEKAVIKGSEQIKGWQNVKPGLWKVTLPYRFFGLYNPYTDKVYGDWYSGWIHTGEVYLDGKPLSELESLQKIMDSVAAKARIGADPVHTLDSTYTWYTQSDSGKTTIYARFGNADPNQSLVEINVRKACFYPKKNHINYITVQHFEMCQAACQWAPPTAEQQGLVGTNWSKGWIIENNIIHDAKCTGVTLGKDRATGDNMWKKDPSIDGSQHYNELVFRVIANGWNKDNIGSHIVRNNRIYNCGQAGICGSFGGAYSTITDNDISGIYTYRVYSGAEMAAIKLHAAIDVLIKDNYLHNASLGLWLDWMAQGTRVSSNLFIDNTNADLFVEVDHGPYLVDNNIFLSANAIQDWSEGGAYAHNLIGGTVSVRPQDRRTPFFKPHTTRWAGVKQIIGGDDRYYNNVFTGLSVKGKGANASYRPKQYPKGYGLSVYDSSRLKVVARGNVYTSGAAASPGWFEQQVTQTGQTAPVLQTGEDGKVWLNWKTPGGKGLLVTTALLGTAVVAHEQYENPDGTPLQIDRDYLGHQRDKTHPDAGPFEGAIEDRVVVWPKNRFRER